SAAIGCPGRAKRPYATAGQRPTVRQGLRTRLQGSVLRAWKMVHACTKLPPAPRTDDSGENTCRYPQSGLTAPSGGIRSASSFGTVVCSSAVVVGQRFERGVP